MTDQETSAGLLYGSQAIANFLGLSLKQARHRIEEGTIPTFKIKGTTCATKERLRSWLDEQAAGGASND